MWSTSPYDVNALRFLQTQRGFSWRDARSIFNADRLTEKIARNPRYANEKNASKALIRLI